MSYLSTKKTSPSEGDNNSGFSLIELTFVIIIVSVVVSTIIFTTQARLDVARIFTTKERMQIIIDALDRYIENYGHIPCPAQINADKKTDNDYGWATGSAADYATYPKGNCQQATFLATEVNGDIVKGMVPIRSLVPALDAQTAVDGWGNRFSYVIMENLSVKDNFEGTGVNPGSDIAVSTHPDRGSGYIGSPAIIKGSFLLISHGPNGHGSYRDRSASLVTASSPTNDDLENSDADIWFSQSMPLAQYYDDILLVKARWQLPEPIN